jgi:hypothetical protein
VAGLVALILVGNFLQNGHFEDQGDGRLTIRLMVVRWVSWLRPTSSGELRH